MQPPPGWYSTSDPTVEQWWDGGKWTGQTRLVRPPRSSGASGIIVLAVLALLAAGALGFTWSQERERKQDVDEAYQQMRCATLSEC